MERPNVLILMDDQHRHDAFGFAGNPHVQTPHLDQLASESVWFRHALTPTPVCVPARMSLLTGHRASVTRWTDNSHVPGPVPELPTFATLMHRAGYYTKGVGKMHFGGRHYGLVSHESMEEVVDHRVDDDYLMYLARKGVRARFPQGLRDLLYYQPQTSGVPEEHSKSRWVAKRSVAFLREHNRYRGNQPFLLWSSFTAPHPPFAPSSPYDDMYEPSEMPLPAYTDRPLADLPLTLWPHRARLDGAHRDPDRMRRLKALYYGLVSQVDDCVGQILSELRRLELAENTVVLFLSDHGEMLGDHGLSQKNAPYEASVRIPLLLRWPGATEAGSISDDLVGITDILPTLLDGLELGYPTGAPSLPGSSLLDNGGGLGVERRAYFSDYGRGDKRWLSVRTKRFTYAYFYGGGVRELYDNIEDPQQTKNLLGERPDVALHLHKQLLDWEINHGFGLMVEGGDFKAFPVPPRPSDDDCRRVEINEGAWPKRLPRDELSEVETFAEAFSRAIAKETCLEPSKLSLDHYKAKVEALERGERGGEPLTGTPWEEVWHETEPALPSEPAIDAPH